MCRYIDIYIQCNRLVDPVPVIVRVTGYIYIYIYILMVISYMSIIAEGMMKSCRSIWEEGVGLRCNTRAEEKKISEGGSIWEVLREYGAGTNRVLEEFTEEMRVLVEE